RAVPTATTSRRRRTPSRSPPPAWGSASITGSWRKSRRPSLPATLRAVHRVEGEWIHRDWEGASCRRCPQCRYRRRGARLSSDVSGGESEGEVVSQSSVLYRVCCSASLKGRVTKCKREGER